MTTFLKKRYFCAGAVVVAASATPINFRGATRDFTEPPSTECQAQLDGYCNANLGCFEALGAKDCNVDALYARHDAALDKVSGLQWRCYSSSSLTADLQHYANGSCYCTHEEELEQVLSDCESGKDVLVDVFVSGQEGYACYRIPSMIHVGGDDVLVFAEGRKYSCADHGHNDVVLKRSTDGGRTWGALEFVYGESDAMHNVTIGNEAPILVSSTTNGASGNDIVLVACRNNKGVLQLRSQDFGRTWSAMENVSSATLPTWNWVATGPPQGQQLSNGRLVLGSDHIDNSGAWGSHIMFSDDNGETWELGPELPDGNECQVAQLKNGSLLVNMRSRDKKRHFSWSHDNGSSWTTSITSPFDEWTPLGSDCEGSTVALPESGLLTFSTPFSLAGRDNMTLFTSNDGGMSWVPRVQVDAGPSAYSALNALNETHVSLVYEAEGYGRIRFGVFDVSSS